MKKTSLMFLGSTVQKYAKISVTKGGGRWRETNVTDSFATEIEAHTW